MTNHSALDKLIVREFAAFARIGWFLPERAFPQKIVLDLELGTDTRKAAQTKDLADSVCYLTVKEQVQKFIEAGEWVLLEELAEKVSEFIFTNFAPVMTIKLQIRKFLLTDATWGGIEIIRSR